MSAKVLAGVFLIGGVLWVVYRTATHQPINPFDKNKLGAVEATKTGQNAAEGTAENAQVQQYDYLKNSASMGQVLQSALDKYKARPKVDNSNVGQVGLVEEVKKNALPAAAAASAATAIAIAQKFGLLKGITPKLIPLVKTPAGIIKPAATVKSPTTLAKALPTKIGTQPLEFRKPLTVEVPKPPQIIKAVAVEGKTITAAAIDSTKALNALKAAGRVAGKLVLPISVGLSVYDAAERIQRKGAENFDVGDAVASASGLGGFGLRQYLPDWLKGLAGTKFSEIPAVVGQNLQTSANQRAAAMAAVRSRYQAKYRSGG